MPSLHTIHTQGGAFSRQLECLSEYIMKATRSIGYLVIFLGSSTIMTVTMGAPYLHYRLYTYSGENPTEKWTSIVRSLGVLWDHFSHLPLHLLPIVFPMVSSSGLSLCSTATFVATMTLTVGVVSVATSSIYKFNAKALRNERAIDEWLEASQPAWRKVSNKSFWVFISLPTVVFSLSVGLFNLTVILTVWERFVVDTTASPKIQGCSANKLQAFKVISLVILAPIIGHFVFILTKIHSLTKIHTAEATIIA